MAWPATSSTATWDRTSNTEGRAVDSILHPMLCAKSQWLSALKVGAQVDEPKVEWVSANTNSRIITAVDHSGATTIDGHATNAVVVFSEADAAKIKVGALLKNATRATPIGTYMVDEVMQATALAEADSGYVHVTVTRDYGRNNSGNGSTAHVHTDTFEILYQAVEEGSDPSGNKYKATTLSENYTSILDFYITVTGTEMARRPLIAADNIQRQYEDRMIELKNDLSAMTLYGALNNGANAGSDSYVRTTKGLAQALGQSGANIDYTSTAITEDAVNALFEAILNDGCDRAEPYKILVHPAQARVINSFGSDKVRIERVDQTWGRYVTTFLSDLGFEAEIIADPLVSKSNLFIVNMNKVELVPFRPWQKLEWGMDTSTPDGSDAYKMRVLGEYTFKVVDPLKAHASMTLLTWPS